MDAVFDAIQDGLKESGEVRLVGFGTFETVKREASTGRNPRTGERDPDRRLDVGEVQGRQGA